ncbi:hypothetical protein PY793_10070 [Acetobacter fabarum]|uniref:hypothetical protein n=1 Tax=Acetobacter fabarum TaxID=483199 RepID=UPI00312B47B6
MTTALIATVSQPIAFAIRLYWASFIKEAADAEGRPRLTTLSGMKKSDTVGIRNCIAAFGTCTELLRQVCVLKNASSSDRAISTEQRTIQQKSRYRENPRYEPITTLRFQSHLHPIRILRVCPKRKNPPDGRLNMLFILDNSWLRG